MRILDEAQFNSEAKPVLEKIFNTNVPPGDSILLNSNIDGRRILFLPEIYINNDLIDAVIFAAKSTDESGCYVSLTDKISTQPNHCYIPLEEMHVALVEGTLHHIHGIDFWSDYAIYSSRGYWGLLASSAKYGLLGGSSRFIERVESIFPSLNTQLYDFIAYWEREQEIAIKDCQYPEMLMKSTWILDLIKHAYGDMAGINIASNTKLFF